MREKQGIFKYVLIATHKVSSFEEQRMREQEWVDKLKPTLNILNPYTSISYCEICNKRISVIHWKHENSEEHKWNHYEIDENLIEDIQKWRKKNEPKKEPKKEPKQPKSKPYCEICDIEDNDLKYHKKQEQHIWNYYEIDESLIQDIHKWREDERKRKYETDRYQKRRWSAEDYHLWMWERAILSGQNPDIPIPFKFDETKNIMIIDYDGNECSKDMSNWYSLQKYYCPRCKDYFDNKHNHE